MDKAVTPTVATPGDWITFTIKFGNEGSLPAENVVLTDALPTGLVNASWSAWVSNGLPVKLRSGTTYVWDLPDLAWMEYGVLTLTAQLDPSFDWSGITGLDNAVTISTSSVEQYQVPQWPNSAAATVSVQMADVEISKSVTPPKLRAGDWLTYTIVYTNHGQLAAANTVITDLLHSWLGNSSYGIWTSYYPTVIPSPTGNYVWTMGNVPAGGWGVITVTAQVSPSLSGGGALPNTASIATTTPERDYTNNSADASNIVVYYDVDLQPDAASLTDSPGNTVTYTLTLYNTGNADDTYTLSKAGNSWTTNLPATVGVLAGGNAQFQMTVQIPSGASNGDHDTVTVTAISQGDLTKSDTSVFTTTAQSGTLTYGVDLPPDTASQSGTVGQTITYTLRVTNTGNVADTISLSATPAPIPGA